MQSETPKEAAEAATRESEPATVPAQQDDADKEPEAEKEIDRTELDAQLQKMGYLADDIKFYLEEYDGLDTSAYSRYVTV
jgi:hypothetical protein